jgi:sec-independent protein translocase protein TatC
MESPAVERPAGGETVLPPAVVSETAVTAAARNDTASAPQATANDATVAALAAEGETAVMTVVEHLDELRKRLMRSILYIAVSFVAALFMTSKVIDLLKVPAGPNMTFQALTLEEPVVVFLKVAFYLGIIISSPLILLEISRFVAPGLTRAERRVLTPIVVGSPALFAVGALFAYFCLLPPMLHFFGVFSQGVVQVNQRLDYYISLVSSILLYMGLCFQLPIIIFVLSFTGLVTSKHLISFWKYALVGISVIAAIVTPDPTAFSMLIVMAALSVLYLLSVILLKVFGR